MRNFEEIEKELGLKKFLSSSLGTLYFVPSSLGSKRVIVRRFDNKLPSRYTQAYVALIKACDDFVKSDLELSKFIQIELPFEEGIDFYARTHHTYTTSTASYVEEHNPPKEPDEIITIRELLEDALSKYGGTNRENIIKHVLERSLLEPSSKTYFNDVGNSLIVVEPKIDLDDVLNW